ncbi:MAG: hypothetical protein AAGK21_06685 [Bacteroidota bacterium]
MRLLSLAALVVAQTVVLSPTASSQEWLTDWAIIEASRERDVLASPVPLTERAAIADKHEAILEEASAWYASLGFSPPLQHYGANAIGQQWYIGILKDDAGEIGSSHSENGRMQLTSNPGFLTADTPLWRLMEASAVHELFHGIQKAYPAYYTTPSETLPECVAGSSGANTLGWIGEGMPSAVQIQWIERTWREEGRADARYGHPFLGSSNAAWVRHFDQSLHIPSVAPQYRQSGSARDAESTAGRSWYCSYGTWYFWYAVGELLASEPDDRTAYLRHIYERVNGWHIGGLAIVDAGLRVAADELDSIEALRDTRGNRYANPYRAGGLYVLYPEFIAQYANAPAFYESVREVQVSTPGLYEEVSAPVSLEPHHVRGEPLAPVASRAWRVEVVPPPDAPGSSVTVRIGVEAGPGTDRDDLHLIVDHDVVTRPRGKTVPYDAEFEVSATTSTSFLVRVANVAMAAEETAEANYRLRVEVGGFYSADAGPPLPPTSNGSPAPTATPTGAAGTRTGSVSNSGESGASPLPPPSTGERDGDRVVVGGLPSPGFSIRGPEGFSCSGDARARAIFDYATPDEKRRDIERIGPETVNTRQEGLSEAELAMKRMERAGQTIPGMAEAMEAMRGSADLAELEALEEELLSLDPMATVDEDILDVTSILATFVGQNGGDECQMVLRAQRPGADFGPGVLAGAVDADLHPDPDTAPEFAVGTFDETFLNAMRTGAVAGLSEPAWQVCMISPSEAAERQQSATSGCRPVLCTPGQLTLDRAEQGHIAGTFEFEVIRWRPQFAGRSGTFAGCEAELAGRQTVTGQFNVTSTDDGLDDGGLMLGTMPGAPILLDAPD